MLKSNGKKTTVKYNYHITTTELKHLWNYSKNWGLKWRVLIGLCCFRGLRISEALAINIFDFKDDSFTSLTYRTAKTNKIESNKPIIKPLACLIKSYVISNLPALKNGFLFPYYNKASCPHMTTRSAEALFSKLRKKIGAVHPEFLDKYYFKTDKNTIVRYRIGFHSLRRWFETNIYHFKRDPFLVKEVMGYDDVKSITPYINGFEMLNEEPQILKQTFGELYKNIERDPQQTKLDLF